MMSIPSDHSLMGACTKSLEESRERSWMARLSYRQLSRALRLIRGVGGTGGATLGVDQWGRLWVREDEERTRKARGVDHVRVQVARDVELVSRWDSGEAVVYGRLGEEKSRGGDGWVGSLHSRPYQEKVRTRKLRFSVMGGQGGRADNSGSGGR